MKGPGVRVDQDVRRFWRCPRCEKVKRTQGSVVAVPCNCSNERVWMVLEKTPRTPIYVPPPRELEPVEDYTLEPEPPRIKKAEVSPIVPETVDEGAGGADQPISEQRILTDAEKRADAVIFENDDDEDDFGTIADVQRSASRHGSSESPRGPRHNKPVRPQGGRPSIGGEGSRTQTQSSQGGRPQGRGRTNDGRSNRPLPGAHQPGTNRPNRDTNRDQTTGYPTSGGSRGGQTSPSHRPSRFGNSIQSNQQDGQNETPENQASGNDESRARGRHRSRRGGRGQIEGGAHRDPRQTQMGAPDFSETIESESRLESNAGDAPLADGTSENRTEDSSEKGGRTRRRRRGRSGSHGGPESPPRVDDQVIKQPSDEHATPFEERSDSLYRKPQSKTVQADTDESSGNDSARGGKGRRRRRGRTSGESASPESPGISELESEGSKSRYPTRQPESIGRQQRRDNSERTSSEGQTTSNDDFGEGL